MLLSKQLADRYGRYRVRFLEGTKGHYQGPELLAIPVLTHTVDGQRKDTRPQFLRQLSANPAIPGTYVTASVFQYLAGTGDDPTNVETSDISGMKHGDNVLYSSWAFLSFVCEYIITLDLAALQTAVAIYESFQRLGDYEPGFGEPSRSGRPAGEYWGYLLRADDVDDAEQDERIQEHLANPAATSNLEPSPDQYTSLFCTSAIAIRLLTEAQQNDVDFPSDQQHQDLRDKLAALLKERVRNAHAYVATHCRYLLRRADGFPASRGPWCWQFSYEFAKVACQVVEGNQNNLLGYFEPFLFEMLPDILDTFVFPSIAEFADKSSEKISAALTPAFTQPIFDKYFADVRKSKFQNLSATIPILNDVVDLWTFLGNDFSKLDTDVDGEIKARITTWIATAIEGVLRNAIKSALQTLANTGETLDKAASLVISKFLFRTVASLVFKRPFPVVKSGFLDSGNNGTFFQDLGLFDSHAFATTIAFPGIGMDVKTKPFTITIGGYQRHIGTMDFGHFELDSTEIASIEWGVILDLCMVPFQIGAFFLLQEIFEFIGLGIAEYDALFHQNVDTDVSPFDADYMPFGYFVLMATNGSFTEHGFADQMSIASQFANGLFMALNHRLFGLGGTTFDDVMKEFDRAPDTFPNGHDVHLWDKDFRWVRNNFHAGNGGNELYNGLDYMCALMIAATANARDNRQVVRDAVEAAISADLDLERLESPGAVNLPFRGPIAVTMTLATGINGLVGNGFGYYVAVVFAEPGTPGKMVLRFDAMAPIEFDQSAPARTVLVPTLADGIKVDSIDVGVAGVISVFAATNPQV